MAKLSLLEAFGFSASGELKEDANLLRSLPQFATLKTVRLDQVPLAKADAGLTFKQPLPVNAPGLSLTIGAGSSGHIRIVTSSDHLLDINDPFSSISVDPGEIYLALGLEFSATAGAAVNVSPLGFGFSGERGFSTTVYRRFFRSDNGQFPLFGQALTETLSSFVIPQTRADLDNLDRNSVIVTAGSGLLKLSASFGIQSDVRQLAATSPVAGRMVEVNASASFTSGFSIALEGDYQVRLRRLPSESLEMGVYQSKSQTFTVQVAAEAGVSAAVGRFDLAEKFIAALSKNPVVDRTEFQRALPDEDHTAQDLQIAAFQRTLGAAISTSVQASLTASISNLRSDESVLLYEVSPAAATLPTALPAIVAAFAGDFTPLTQGGVPLPPGIKQTSNVFTRTDLTKHKLSLNMLGLVNFVSAGKLARIAEVSRNENGEITLITDTADANRLQALLLNVAGNSKRLQAMLSEDFLFQATFKVVDLKVFPPDLSAKHTFIEVNGKTDRNEMKNLLDVCRVLGLVSGEAESERLQALTDFGRTTFWLQTKYSSAALERTLLTAAGTARPVEEFAAVGRQSLGQLLTGDEGQEFRKQLADAGPKGTAIWQDMKRIGNTTQFAPLFGLPLGSTDPRVAAAAADYVCISSWAKAMNRLASCVVEMRMLLSGVISPDSEQLISLRKVLRDRLADVVKNSGEHFGEPLGLVTVFLASGNSAAARVILNGPSIPTLTSTVAASALSAPATA